MSAVNRIPNSSMALTTTPATERQTPRTDFGAKLGKVLEKVGDAAALTGAIIAPVLPPAGLVSAAITGTRAVASSAKQLADGSDGVSAMPTAGSPLDGLDSGSQDLLDATRELQSMNHAMNLEMLNLQQSANQQQRTFTTLSQLLASRHQAARTAIQNIGR